MYCLGLQYKAPLNPPPPHHVYCKYPPPPWGFLFPFLCQPWRLLELRKNRNQPDLHTRAPQLYAPLVVLTAVAADRDPLIVLLLPQVPVDWPVAGCVHWLIVGTVRKLIPSLRRCVGMEAARWPNG